jgi:hypothetical protein
MPRQSRLDTPGVLQHVIVRGIEKRKIFLDDTDRDMFVKRFADLLKSTGTECLAWALLPNHSVREMGKSGAEVGAVLNMKRSGVCLAARRGEKAIEGKTDLREKVLAG